MGSYGEDLKYIIAELKYPRLTDRKMLTNGYLFRVPAGQKFNILNASDEIFLIASNDKGFFNLVNSIWLDAAVAQKA